MPSLPENAAILAIDPTSQGFAYAVLEVPAHLLYWGSKEATTKSTVQKVGALLSYHQPDVLMLEDLAAKGARRRKRARKEIQAIERLARRRGVKVEHVARLAVQNAFAPGKSKYEVAVRLAEIFPVLAPRLPRRRKAWTTEDARMNIFDALGFARVFAESAARTPTLLAFSGQAD